MSCNQPTMTTINDLPIEILSRIFSNLSMNHIVRVRSVSRLWRVVADKQKIEDLVIFDIHDPSDTDKPVLEWFYTNDKINKADVLQIDLFGKGYDLFQYQSYQLDLLKNLKRLKIGTDSESQIHRLLYNLFRFPALEQLDCDVNFQKNSDLMICHDNLKVLQYFDYCLDRLELLTPNLEFLRCDGNLDENRIKFCYPNKLQYVSAPEFHDLNHLTRFKNLKCIDECWLLDFDGQFIKGLTKLTEIRFKFAVSHGGDDDDSDQFDGAYSMFENSMVKLVQMKKKLNRKDLKIYFDESELKSVDQFKKLLCDYKIKFLLRYGCSRTSSDSPIEEIDLSIPGVDIIEEEVIDVGVPDNGIFLRI